MAAAGTRTGTGAPALVPVELGGAALCCSFGRGTGRERFTGSGPWRTVLLSASLFAKRPPRAPQGPPPVSTGRNPPTQANGCLQGHGTGKLELVERVGEEMEGMRLPPRCGRAASTPPCLSALGVPSSRLEADSLKDFVWLRPRPSPSRGEGGQSERYCCGW